VKTIEACPAEKVSTFDPDPHKSLIQEITLSIQIGNYLEPTFFIDCDNPDMRELAEEITRGQHESVEKAVSLFYYVRDTIKYNLYVPKSHPEDFRASNILSAGKGFCVQKAVALVALARAVNIQAGLGFARLKNHIIPEKTREWLRTDILPFHGFTELYLQDKWVIATPAFDREMCEKNGIIPVEFDGMNDAKFRPFNLDGERHIEYLGDVGHYYDDVPLEQLRAAVTEAHGKEFLDPPPR
jgi:transglutaminase-like putative cysteine protease